MYPPKFIKHLPKHVKKSHRSDMSFIERFPIAIEGMGHEVVHGAQYVTKKLLIFPTYIILWYYVKFYITYNHVLHS